MSQLLRLDPQSQQAAAFIEEKDRSALIHQLVVSYQANARQGTRAQKNRASVKHTTAKPWKQKHTGRARAGMKSSPLWRGGGRAFPSSPDENFSQKVNRKSYSVGMRAILGRLIREQRVCVLDDEFFSGIDKTKAFVARLSAAAVTMPVLLVLPQVSESLWRSCRNVPNVYVLPSDRLDPVTLLGARTVLMGEGALAALSERFGV